MLLEHNVDVYNQLNSVLANNNCACVIMGTGVGKSYVAFEYLTQHKYTALVVSPRTSINNSWSKLCGSCVDTITYQKLANIYKDIDYSFYDVVICDEVHHIGAPKWGVPIRYILDKGVRVIGLTESSIRYTDGGRDVAQEYFNGNVVFGVSVSDGIKKQILNPVTYVGAMYNSDGLKKTIRGKIQSRLYAKLNLAINNTPTVQEILKKNMPDGRRKGIIFASTIDDIKFAIDFVHSVYPKAKIRFVHSKQPDSYNASVMKWFKRTKEGYVCSVDMISEGVHIKGVNTLIMLRRTESVNLFNQQLGRCLDANSKEPAIVFDLVNNKYSIKIINNKMRIKNKSIFDSGSVVVSASEQLIIKDYTKDIVAVLKEIADDLSRFWTDDEVKFLTDNFGVLSIKDIAASLNRPVYTVYSKISAMGLAQQKSFWPYEDIEILKKYYPIEGIQCINRFNGKYTASSIHSKANKLGLSVDVSSDEFKKFKQDVSPLKKKVLCVELNLIFDSLSSAVKYFDFDIKTIPNLSACCKGRKKTWNGYHWKYID